MINKVLNDRYEIIELIGRGGMAYVYKAKDLKLNRFVAVKVLREEYTENEQFVKKFDRESQAAAGLSHPNIVSVYDVGVQGNIYYIIMEYVDGITLKQYLDKKGYLDYKETTHFIIEIAKALKCAHEHKIIHRDIKPHNILLTKNLVPKVADFGIARAITSSTITMTNQTMGSVHYISPEQARGGFVDERSDIYSLGIMYYELLTGQLPFDEENTVSIAIKHIQDQLNPPKNLVEEIPQSVNDVVVKMTNKKPEDRYQNCDELIEDLEKIMENPNALVAGNADNLLSNDETQIIGGDSLFKIEPTTSIPGGLLEENDNEDLEEELDASRKKRRNRILIAVISIIAALAIVVVAVNAFSNQRVTVPDLRGRTQEEAQQELESLGLTLEVEGQVYSNDVPAGQIAEQNPENGTELREGQTVKVKISQGAETVTVPDVIGMTENEAVKALESAGLASGGIQREYSNKEKGTVYDVDPGEGEQVTAGTQVVLYVSNGPEPVQQVSVPNVIGQTLENAQAALTSAGLTVGNISYNSSSQYPSGSVIYQSQDGGKSVDEGTSIDLVISTGPQSTPSDSTGNNSDNSGSDSNTGSSSGDNTGGSSGSGSGGDSSNNDSDNSDD